LGFLLISSSPLCLGLSSDHFVWNHFPFNITDFVRVGIFTTFVMKFIWRRERDVYIFRNLYKIAAVLKMEAVPSVETLVSGYQTLRRHIAEEGNVKSAVLLAVEPPLPCNRTQTVAVCAYTCSSVSKHISS
jgi:hypothetical protein